MSRTLSLSCDDCRQTLWVGQHSNSVGWYLYLGDQARRDKLDAFVNAHMGHSVKFEDSDAVSLDFEDLTDYGKEGT